MQIITQKQQDILNAIRSHIKLTGQSPTVREIGAAVGLRSSCSVQRQVEALERAGKIRRSNFKYRSIEVVGDEKLRGIETNNVAVPVLGLVAGGSPIEALQDPDPELLSIPSSLLPRFGQNRQGSADFGQLFFEAPFFGFRVVGKSMIDVGIDDGDLVIARRQPSAENGEIVVALVEGDGATVKKFYREGGRIRLQPANEAYSAIYCDEVQVLGKVALSIKQF